PSDGQHRDLHSFPTRRSSDLMKRHRAQVFSTGPSTSAWGPFTCGVRHPFILIPAAFFLPPSRQVLVSVVAHELAHVQRGDMLLRSEEHTSELQSRGHLVCRLL